MIEKIEEYAHINRIPIMQKDGITYLCNLIKENNIKNILEIGSAIGYSAIKMALLNEDIHVTTIEKDEERYNIAVNNIREFNLGGRINIILDDALNTEINDKFDLIFIDASKGNNINFFNKYSKNLANHGIIVTDNLHFHGLVLDESLIKTKNQRGIVRKIKEFITFLEENEDYDTEIISVGDGIALSKRKEDKYE
jgi:predicted O-methyltransferase YrrM